MEKKCATYRDICQIGVGEGGISSRWQGSWVCRFSISSKISVKQLFDIHWIFEKNRFWCRKKNPNIASKAVWFTLISCNIAELEYHCKICLGLIYFCCHILFILWHRFFDWSETIISRSAFQIVPRIIAQCGSCTQHQPSAYEKFKNNPVLS